MYTNPSVADFKAQLVRDFPYGTDPNVSVLDSDINNAQVPTLIEFNPALWDNQTAYSYAFNLLTAHNLVLALRASSQGINGQWNWIQNSKSVGNVSEAFTIPQRIIDNPDFATYTKTNYGAQYLALLWPLLVGNMFTVRGHTKP